MFLSFFHYTYDAVLDAVCRLILNHKELYSRRRRIQMDEIRRTLCHAIISSQTLASPTHNTIKKYDDKAIASFVKDILDENKSTPTIVGVKSDENNTKITKILLAVKDSKNSYEQIVEYPLVEFATELSNAFENKLTSTTLCFIADASGGLGTEMLGRIIASCGAGLNLIEEPVWMSMVANLASEKVIKKSNMKKVVFALCRMCAWELRDQIGENRTVVFTLPGQASTAALLPSIQAAFPCERHVFIYDGCIDSTARAIRKMQQKEAGDNNVLPMKMSRKISTTTPISQVESVANLSSFLTSFSSHLAGVVEAWLSSVDAFLKLKHNEKKTGYTPFVCRTGFLMSHVGRLGNGKIDQSELALINVLQYITGSRSRPLKDEVLKEARRVLNEIRDADNKENEIYTNVLGEKEKEAIEACAFAHKGILIENKTLMDTVQPQKEWSLKAAKKLTSCACCMPGEGDEEDEDEEGDGENDKENFETTVDKVKVKPVSRAQVYVDGKTTFAFDPTRFA